jgi:branched-chain amino acid transport system substrate-binding protein
MKLCITNFFSALALTLTVSATPTAHAQIRLGQSLDLSGVTSPYSKDYLLGMRAHFAAINKAGGIAGQQVELVALDDNYDPAKTLRITEGFIADPALIGLMGYRGTQNIQAALPSITQAKIALVGTTAGAVSLRHPHNPYLFHNRADLAEEVAALVKQATAVGQSRIAIGYQDDAFGRSGMAAFEAAMAKQGLKPAASGAIPRDKIDVDAAAVAIAAAKPQLVIIVGQAASAAALVKAIRVFGHPPQFAVTSVSSGVYADLKEQAEGVIVSQVVPSPTNPRANQLVIDYQREMAQSGQTGYTNSTLEGYLVAKIVSTALRNAGTKPTRASFQLALNSMQKIDFGGLVIHYTAQDHAGSHYVNIGILRKDGSLAL